MKIDLTGQTLGHLTVLRWYPGWRYLCKCECGNTVTVTHDFLKSDKIKSCGCKSWNNRFLPGTKKLYKQWQKMMRVVRYRTRQGIQGELIHPDWTEYPAFAAWAVSVGYIDGLELDAVMLGKSFSPLNCRWVWEGTRKKVFMPRLKKINGVPLDLHKLADDCGIPYATLNMRLRNGWTLLDAMTRPVQKQARRRKASAFYVTKPMTLQQQENHHA